MVSPEIRIPASLEAWEIRVAGWPDSSTKYLNVSSLALRRPAAQIPGLRDHWSGLSAARAASGSAFFAALKPTP